LIVACSGHITLLGATGPGPNEPTFFKGTAVPPCPVLATDAARRNVTLGSTLTLSWAMQKNHNFPPNPVGKIIFEWYQGTPNAMSTNWQEVAPWVPVVVQPTGIYFTESITMISGDISGRATLRVHYDVNGGLSPYPDYYQCVDLWVR